MSLVKSIPALFAAAAIFCAPVATTVALVASAPAQAQAPAADAAKPAEAAPAAAPAPAPAAAPAAAAKTEKVAVDNPYGIKALVGHGDWISLSVLAILVIMSMGSWYILVVKLFEQRKINKDAKAAAESFWSAGTLQQGIATLDEGSAFRFIADSGVKAGEHHGGLMGDVDLNSWVTTAIQRAQDNVNNRLGDGLAFLATVGSTSPFVGLFGTVYGIYGALTAIGVSGQASIDKVAGPVGEALIMTAVGLAVAVPAVLSYNWLIRRNKSSMESVRAFSGDLHSVLMSQGAKKK
jgi:biopolymer transport protein ExbB